MTKSSGLCVGSYISFGRWKKEMKNSLRLESKSGAGNEVGGTGGVIGTGICGGTAHYVPGHATGDTAGHPVKYPVRNTAKEAASDKEQILNKSVYYSRYYSPLDYFLERASRWVLVFAFLYMLAQIIRVVIR
jgi:hypothetical protein